MSVIYTVQTPQYIYIWLLNLNWNTSIALKSGDPHILCLPANKCGTKDPRSPISDVPDGCSNNLVISVEMKLYTTTKISHAISYVNRFKFIYEMKMSRVKLIFICDFQGYFTCDLGFNFISEIKISCAKMLQLCTFFTCAISARVVNAIV